MLKYIFAIRIAWIFLFFGILLGCNSPQRRAERSYQDGIRLKERNELQQALVQFQNALALNPRHINAHIEVGILLCQDEHYAESIKYFLQAVEYGAESYKPYAYMGYAYEQLGQLTMAEEQYKKAIHLVPELFDVRLRLADVLEAQGKRLEAAEVLQAVVRLNPDIENSSALRLRMSLLRQPESPSVHRALADVYITLGELDKGIAEYRQAESLDPDKPDTLARFGMFCAEREQYFPAITYLTRALQLGVSNEAEARLWLGSSHEEVEHIHDAIAEYQRVLQLVPHLYVVYLKVAELLEEIEHDADAADVLEQLFRGTDYVDYAATHDGYPDVNQLWGEILRLRGESSKKAVVQFKRYGQYHLIDLVVNQTIPVKALVDANATYTIISEKFAQALNIELTSQTSEVHFTFMGQSYTAPVVNLDSIQVGGIEVHNIPALIWDFSNYPGIDGLLGKSFLKHFQVEIKLDEQLLVLQKLYS